MSDSSLVVPDWRNGQAPSAGHASAAVLRLLVKGFSPVEHRLLEGADKLSQRRAPRIDLVSPDNAASADVVLIDATDAQAIQWASGQPWLAGRAAIWAGAKAARPEHMVVERHVKWTILPVLLYRALERAPAGRRAAPAPAPASSRRVLVVDDSLAVRNYLRSLLDVLMPGMDGFEACRRLKASAQGGATLPVVMLTSKSSPFDRVRGKMAGCDNYLTKPVNPEELRAVVGAHLVPADA